MQVIEISHQTICNFKKRVITFHPINNLKYIFMKSKLLFVSLLFICITTKTFAVIYIITVSNFDFSPSDISINTGDTARFQWVSGSHTVNSETGAWTDFNVNSSSPQTDVVLTTAGTYAYYCDFHGGPGGTGMSGNITVTVPPCNTPTGLIASMITSSSAKILWTAVTGATKYQIQYRAMGATTWTKVSTMALGKKLIMLSPSTNYQYKVKTICGTSSSPFSSVQTFTTLPMRLLNTDFEDINIYPNPNNGIFKLEISDLIPDNYMIDITDITGRILYSKSFSIQNGIINEQIKLPATFTGIAMVNIYSNQWRDKKILIVE